MLTAAPTTCTNRGCRNVLVQPATGRPRLTCSERCRRARSRRLAREARKRSVEYYTPPEVFAWFAERWGPFGFDPASCPAAPVWALVPDHLTAAEDGLVTPWRGRRAFVNPPYGRGLLAAWTERAWRAVRDGEVETAAMLVPLRPSSAWTRTALERGAELVPYTVSRIRFFEPDGAGGVVQTSGALFECCALVFRDTSASRNSEAA